MMNKYLEILEQIEQKRNQPPQQHVVLVDSLNTFIRNFTTLKSMNPQGHHIGGLLGFLRSLGYMVRTLDPSKIICVFDGKGSSMNRKNIDVNYKANREATRITNWGMFDTKGEERESMSAQINRLMDYLECLPVTVLMYDKIEADDIISYLAQEYANKGIRVTIVSSDRDFLQIIREDINIYSPIKKELFDTKNIEQHLGVHPTNYLIFKALAGDSSDNLSGIKGLGAKGIVKLFPRLVTEPNVPLSYIYEECEKNLQSKKKIYAGIIFDWDKVEKNYELMNIQNPRLTDEEKSTILDELRKSVAKLQGGIFLRYMEQDHIEGITNNTEVWLEQFRPLTLKQQ